MNNRPFISLRFKLAVSFALLAILTVGAVSYFAYQNTREQLDRDIRARHVRIERIPGADKTKPPGRFHFRNFLVYGKKLY